MFLVGECPSCGGGNLGIRVCSETRKDLVVLCDECDACWLTVDFSLSPIYPKQPELPCPICTASLVKETSRWATLEEIKKRGWSDFIQGENLSETTV